jgi:hypothetical protein
VWGVLKMTYCIEVWKYSSFSYVVMKSNRETCVVVFGALVFFLFDFRRFSGPSSQSQQQQSLQPERPAS